MDRMTPAEWAASRRLTGLTLDQLAAELHVNPRTVRSWEQGRDPIPAGAAEQIDALVDEVIALARTMADTEGVVTLPREDGDRPRGWYLAAAAHALTLEPDLMLEWGAPR